MEARGKGRTLNTRLSQSVRGEIVTHTRHLAAKFGIAVVIVPARGTSKYCPKCLAAFCRRTAPDRTTPGWKWAVCPNEACGYSADRDVAAWQRIGARGLQHQHPPHPAARTAAGTASDEHPHAAPADRGQTRRRLPPARPRHSRHTTETAWTTAEISFPPGLGENPAPPGKP
ncbi:zinc ribbon domain-containing protein [Streptomyces sp. SYSU K217416]